MFIIIKYSVFKIHIHHVHEYSCVLVLSMHDVKLNRNIIKSIDIIEV